MTAGKHHDSSLLPGIRSYWIKNHAAAIFVGLLIVVGLIFLIFGILLQAKANASAQTSGLLDFSHTFLFALAGTALAAGIGTAFLSLPDIRSHLASTMTTLFSEGGVVGYLSNNAQEVIEREMIFQRLGDNVQEVELDLLAHLQLSASRSLQSIHLANYDVFTTLRPCESRRELLLDETVITFQIRCSHLKGTVVDYPYKFVAVTSPAPEATSGESDSFRFSANFGEEEFSTSDLLSSEVDLGGVKGKRFQMERNIKAFDGMNVTIRTNSLVPQTERSIAALARYPTKGFKVTISHSEKFVYEYMWFKGDDPKTLNLPGEQEYHLIHGGISARTTGWLLPGEGVTVEWSLMPT